MNWKTLFALGLSLTVVACAVVPTTPPIPPTSPTPPNQLISAEIDLWPEVGFLTEGGILSCSIVMIDTDIALTAAHCIGPVGEFKVHLSNGQSSAVVHIESADWTREVYKNDIAVLFLEDSILDEKWIPVLMDREVSLRDMGATVVSVGWSSGEKEHAWSWLLAGMKGGDMLVWLADPGHLWYGDSGGAVFILIDGQVRLAGVNSIIVFSALTREPLGSAATEIAVHRDWLEEVINAYRSN